MPTESTYASFDVPNLDLWAFFFERKDRQYPDDKGKSMAHERSKRLPKRLAGVNREQ